VLSYIKIFNVALKFYGRLSREFGQTSKFSASQIYAD
jgi:hypothetical protein